MAGCRMARPLGTGPRLLIDKGTLCRTATPHRGSLGLPPLSVDHSLITEVRHALFCQTIREALRRGAEDFHLRTLLMKDSFWIKQEATLAGGPFDPVIQELEASWASLAIDQETAAFNVIIERGMESISGMVGETRIRIDTIISTAFGPCTTEVATPILRVEGSNEQ